MDPDGYEPAIVKLFQKKDNYRIVGATRAKLSSQTMSSPGEGKWISQERWPVRLDREERGLYVLHVDQALEPGEYALILRANKRYKPKSAGFGAGAQLFYSVWDFSVPGAPADSAGKNNR